MRDANDKLREKTPATAGASSMTALGRYLREHWLRPFIATLVMGVFLALGGAFGSESLGLPVRLFYWVSLMGLCLLTVMAVAMLMRFGLRRVLPLDGRPITDAVLMVIIASPSIAGVAWAYAPLFGGYGWHKHHYAIYLMPAFTVTAVMMGLSVLLNRTPAQSHAFVVNQGQPVAFRERLPFKYRQSEILALSSEDHYLRVHTEAGETLILMRLYDAVRELEGIEGSQVHRSWWVAKDAIADIERRDGRVILHLENGLKVPVSRTYHKALKASGWL